MSIEMIFLFSCLAFLGAFIVLLTISTAVIGSNKALRLQYMMSALKKDKNVTDIVEHILAKEEVGLLEVSLSGNRLRFYEVGEVPNDGLSWSNRNSHSVSIWIGNRYSNYGYIEKYYSEDDSQFDGKCPAYKTWLKLIALEQRIANKETGINTDNTKAKKETTYKAEKNKVTEIEL